MSVAIQGAARAQQWLWGAPTYDQVRIAWDETRRAALGVATFLKAEMLVTFPGGGVIRFRSLDDPDNARGWTADGVVIDEAADVPEAAWHEVLRPMLLDTGGESWTLGTPKGRNWYWRECVAAADDPDAVFWNAPTLGARVTEQGLLRAPHPLENPNVPWSEIESLFRTLPERVFRQEILAEFVGDEGSVFIGVRAAVDRGRTANEDPVAGRRYFLGVDLARVADFTVLSVMDLSHRQVYLERFNQISWERQIERIVAVSARYNGAMIMLDSTGVGDPIFEALRARGLKVEGFRFTNESKERLIDALAMGIESGGVRLLDQETQTNELLAYQYSLSPSRNIRTGAPPGLHDDTVMALALADWGVAHPGGWWQDAGLMDWLKSR